MIPRFARGHFLPTTTAGVKGALWLGRFLQRNAGRAFYTGRELTFV
jgi:hypothetical protein